MSKLVGSKLPIDHNAGNAPATRIAAPKAAAGIPSIFPQGASLLGEQKQSWLNDQGGAIGSQNEGQPDPETRSARKLCELGLTYAALGEDDAAIKILRQATAEKPELTSAWRKIADLLKRAGDVHGAREADAAYQRAAASSRPSSSLKTSPSTGKLKGAESKVSQRLERNLPENAEALLREHIRRNPTDAAALLILSGPLLDQGRYPEAEAVLERAIELAPSYETARYNYALALFRQNKASLAMPHVQRLLAKDGRNFNYRLLLAGCFAKIGDFAAAAPLYQRLCTEAPRNPALLMNYSNILKTLGRRKEAIEACRACLRMAPTTGEAYFGLAELSSEALTNSDLETMRCLVTNPNLSAADRIHLHYALGRLAESANQIAESFAHYSKGARLKRAEIVYSADETTDRVRRAVELFTPAFFAEQTAHRQEERRGPVPIFIVGLPRSGTTLIEQILASHSAIEGTMELPDIEFIAGDLGDRPGRTGASPYPEIVKQFGVKDCASLGARYVEQTAIYRKAHRPYFIDKMPSNWRMLGLIQTILPEAKIIDARRHPVATCFGAFKTCFAYGQHFSYDLVELGRYYNDYLRLMQHFDTVLPGKIHRVTYETLVNDTEGEVQRLFAYLDLQVEPACFRFWDTERAVSTASSEQVRQPIFREGLDRWRAYEPWLGPLQEVLAQGDVFTD